MQISKNWTFRTPAVYVLPSYFASVFLASFGRGAFYFGSAWVLVEEGYGAAAVAYFFAIVSASELISSPLAGWAADLWDRRWLSVAADILRAAIVFGLAWPSALDPRLLTYVAAGALVCTERLAMTASISLVPKLAGRMPLPKANSGVYVCMQAGNLLAAILGGYLLASYGFRSFCMVIASSFALSAAAMLLVHPGDEPTFVASVDRLPEPVRGARLLDVIALYAMLYGCATLINVMGASLVFEEMRGDAIVFGLIEGAWATGSILGAILIVPISRHLSLPQLGLPILGLTAIALMVTPFATLAILVALFVLLGLLYNLGRVDVEVLLQTTVPINRLGRVKGWTHAAGVFVGGLVLGCVAVAGNALRPSLSFGILGVVIVFSTGIIFIMRLRR